MQVAAATKATSRIHLAVFVRFRSDSALLTTNVEALCNEAVGHSLFLILSRLEFVSKEIIMPSLSTLYCFFLESCHD